MIEVTTYPRAAIAGNPSDGYGGKTIAFPFRNFSAHIYLESAAGIQIEDLNGSTIGFRDYEEFMKTIADFGYDHPSYAPFKLVLAAIKYFAKKTDEEPDNFKIYFDSSIPRGVGLAGSSAIIIATLKALFKYCNIMFVQKPHLAELALKVETDELNIAAGLQDRIVQSYGRSVHMDFKEHNFKTITGLKNRNWYIAYPTTIEENSNIVHSDLRNRFDAGDKDVIETLENFSTLVDDVVTAIDANDNASLNKLIDHNYDLRKSIIAINPQFDRIIQKARSLGASAKFTGSGGAIVGLYKDDAHLDILQSELVKDHIRVIRPNIVGS